MEKFKKINKYQIIIILILLLGIAIRTIGLESLPQALNVDEASAGYEAYSILNYGIDRNGKTMPVFLESWGSGQNALYTYIMIPFVAILGLTQLAIRMPMAIIGCISLFIMYKILKMQNNKKITTIGLAFFAIAPWHIMKSRWGLESNIFPDIMLWSVYFLLNGIKSKKMWKFYIGTAFMGLCSYSYGTSYYFLPIFCLILLGILIKKKKITIKQAIISLSIIGVISLPIILMLIINSFNLPEIKILNFTIPRLESNRYETLTLLSSPNIISTLISNITEGIKILVTQSDGLVYNSLGHYGLIYISSLPITIIGLIKSIKEKNETNLIFNIWTIAAFSLIAICEPNINRINILIIPLIYYTGIGLYELISNFKIIKWVIILVYILQFIGFMFEYAKSDFTTEKMWNNNLENIIKYAENLNKDKIYFEYSIKEPYIYFLFYNKTNTNDFVNTVKYTNNYKDFESVKSFGKYYFEIPEKLENSKNFAYIIKKENEANYEIDEEIFDKKYIDDYIVLERRDYV